MRDSDLDRILSKEEEILPSSGFAASVMETVQREAASPPPIPFPWKRALPGLSAAGLALVSLFVASILLLGRGAISEPLPAEWSSWFASLLQASKTLGANWIALSLLLSLASVKLSMRLASGRAGRPQRT